jgi:glyoxylase-like metal-dependent hydrolase (beta-lactamase superfamily II)
MAAPQRVADGDVPRGPQVTGLDAHADWLAGRFPSVEQVRPGTWAIPVPIPQNPLRYTLSYLLEGSESCLLLDPGWNAPECWEALLDGVVRTGRRPGEISGIVVTHVHPDHHGLSGMLAARTGAWIGMHEAERTVIVGSRTWNTADGLARDREWLHRAGVPVSDNGLDIDGDGRVATASAPADADTLFRDGDRLPLPGRRITAVWTPGHTPGHLCFHDEDADLLFTGDHLLPRISPNIGLHPHTDRSPLEPYLSSLHKVRRFAGAEALPAHEWRFSGVDRRADQLIRHHGDRCDELVRLLAEDGVATAWDVAARTTWSRPWDAVRGIARRSAIAETLAHLEHLAAARRIGVDLSRDGVDLWSPRKDHR